MISKFTPSKLGILRFRIGGKALEFKSNRAERRKFIKAIVKVIK